VKLLLKVENIKVLWYWSNSSRIDTSKCHSI